MAMLTEEDRALIRLYLNDPQGESEVIDDPTIDRLFDEAGNIEAAVARGWRIKAAKVSEWYMTNLDGAFLNREQVFQHCMKMAEYYERIGGASGSMVNVGLRGPNWAGEDQTYEF